MERKTIFRWKVQKSRTDKDGNYKVFLYIHKGKLIAHLYTGMTVRSMEHFDDERFVHTRDSREKNKELDKIKERINAKIAKIQGMEMYTPMQIRAMLAEEEMHIIPTFDSVSENYIIQLRKEGRESYAKLIESNQRYFSEFAAGKMALADITPSTIERFKEFMAAKKISESFLQMTMSRTRTIINRAIKLGLVKYDVHPYSVFKMPKAQVREVDIDIDNFKKMMDYTPTSKRNSFAKDMFMLSFYLGGMNFADMMQVKFDGDTLQYERKKTSGTKQTNKTITIPIIPQANEIIQKYIGDDKMIHSDYKLSYRNLYRYITKILHEIEQEAGITQKVVFYSARKSFAQFATELCVPDAVINYCLGHSDSSRGVLRYYSRVRVKQAGIAISRVADYVEHPDKYEDYIMMRQNIMISMM